jgi:hypothetical protein
MYEAAFGPLCNSTRTYTPRTGRSLLSGPINIPQPFHTQSTPKPLWSPQATKILPCECFVRLCEFGASGVEVLDFCFNEVMLNYLSL